MRINEINKIAPHKSFSQTFNEIMKTPISVNIAINTLIVAAILTGIYIYVMDLKYCVEFLKNTNDNLNSELVSSKEVIHNLKRDLSANQAEITLTKVKLEKALEGLTDQKSFFDMFQNNLVLKYTIYTLAGITGAYIFSGLIPVTFNPIILGYNKIVPVNVRHWCEDTIPLLRDTFKIEFIEPSIRKAEWIAVITNKRNINFSISPYDGTGNTYSLAEYLTHITTISNETASIIVKELPLSPEVSSTVAETITKVVGPLDTISAFIM